MLNIEGLKIEDDDILVVFVRSSMRRDLQRIRSQLCEIAEKEATHLFRLARKMEKRGCNPKVIHEIREEAFSLHMTGYPERLISDSVKWKYAFKI